MPKVATFAGPFSIRLTDEKWQQVRRLARQRGEMDSATIRRLIDRGLQAEQDEARPETAAGNRRN